MFTRDYSRKRSITRAKIQEAYDKLKATGVKKIKTSMIIQLTGLTYPTINRYLPEIKK